MQRRPCRFVGLQFDPFFGQRTAEARQVGQAVAVDDERVERVADAYAARLGVQDDRRALFRVARPVEIGVADAGARFDHRYAGVVAHEVDQSPPAARNDQIDQSRGTEQRGRRFVRGRQQGEGVLVEAVRRERAADQRGDRRIESRASLPPLRMQALPDLTQSAKTSNPTLGRAS